MTGAADTTPDLCLASSSRVRAQLLRAAGLEFDVQTAPVDEDAAKQKLRDDGADARATAEALAVLKAQAVSRQRPGALIIGADQVLELEGGSLDKPADRAAAKDHLRRLRGREHRLVTAACVAQGGRPLWRHTETPRLVMRNFSDAFIDGYLSEVGAAALESVGAYQLEGMGAQLFSAVEGDYFSTLGLPLLPLLAFLREHGVVLE